jgi:hypothetical protein
LKKTFFLKQKIISVENFFVAKLSKNLIFLPFLPVLSFIFCHLQINLLVFFVLFFLATTSIFLLFSCGLSSFFFAFLQSVAGQDHLFCRHFFIASTRQARLFCHTFCSCLVG